MTLVKQKPFFGSGYRAVWQEDDPITTSITDRVSWSLQSSHNAFLETALQLELTGLALILLTIAAVRRGTQCCLRGFNSIGWFSLQFFCGIVVTGQFLETIGQNQVIDWILFSTLFDACGLCLIPNRATQPVRPVSTDSILA